MGTPPAIVIDGDTIRLGSERIRILGIDTPEMGSNARCNAERRLADVAKMTLIDIGAGRSDSDTAAAAKAR